MLLPDLYLDAIKNREKKLSFIRDYKFNDVLKIASTRWVEYQSKKETTFSIGVDSSWNKRSFQGIDLYVIDCITISSTNNIINSRWDYGIGNIAGDYLTSKAMMMEAELSVLSLDKKPDLICVDGSLISNLMHNKSSAYLSKIRELCEKRDNSDVLFVSKNSTSKSQFKQFGSRVADIYYYSKLGLGAGYSLPVTNSLISGVLDIVEVYVRLSSYVPLIKLEIINNPCITTEGIQRLVDKLCYHSVKGYPYCLKLAHKSCTITNDDLKRLASLYGLKNEFGSRDALNV